MGSLGVRPTGEGRRGMGNGQSGDQEEGGGGGAGSGKRDGRERLGEVALGRHLMEKEVKSACMRSFVCSCVRSFVCSFVRAFGFVCAVVLV